MLFQSPAMLFVMSTDMPCAYYDVHVDALHVNEFMRRCDRRTDSRHSHPSTLTRRLLRGSPIDAALHCINVFPSSLLQMDKKDHSLTPNREDEYARIEALGGKVIQWNGYRVLGVLAMSRSIGDRYLKPYIIPVPEVTVVARAREDECLILASDGLWDVLSNEEVCDAARKRILLWHKKNATASSSISRGRSGGDGGSPDGKEPNWGPLDPAAG
ncbi:putative protein phosphatase 2C 53 [Triticum urartu]|uniref:protein-serine/threonine phosphatase n=1 Tax=Triticum urartu TaxID=4572 RepID=M7YR07_TRIUA|nr:putative protein phosphatase 2C 53 [Triticum urartu]